MSTLVWQTSIFHPELSLALMTTGFDFDSPLGSASLNTPSRNANNDLNQYAGYDSSPLNTRHNGSPPSTHGHQPAISAFMAQVPLIDALTVDNLAKDFDLEPRQCANLHAFVQVSLVFSFNVQH